MHKNEIYGCDIYHNKQMAQEYGTDSMIEELIQENRILKEKLMERQRLTEDHAYSDLHEKMDSLLKDMVEYYSLPKEQQRQAKTALTNAITVGIFAAVMGYSATRASQGDDKQ